MPSDQVVERSVKLLKGFADTTRLRILCLLLESEVCVHDLVDVLDISQSGVSHQLRILREARLVKSRKEGRHVYYRLHDSHIGEMLKNALAHEMEPLP